MQHEGHEGSEEVVVEVPRVRHFDSVGWAV
jgi:sulfonate transport system ATP-binding protein